MGLDPRQFRSEVIRPVLDRLDMGGEAAERLLLGTALVESGLAHLRQLGSGPALGLYQMEPATHDDIWWNYLVHRGDLLKVIEPFIAPGAPQLEQLVWNLGYATAMTRLHYRRVPAPLPPPDDLDALGRYWKRHYNTPLGRGRAEEFARRLAPHL